MKLNSKDCPFIYVVAKVLGENGEEPFLRLVTFLIEKEGKMFTGSNSELRIFLSGETWKLLKEKLDDSVQKMEDE